MREDLDVRTDLTRVGQWSCLCGATMGALGLLGWYTDTPRLTTLVPGQPEMMPNTGLGLLLVGVAAALGREAGTRGVRRALSVLAACVVLVIGVGTLAEYVSGIALGIDRLLVSDAGGPYPGRPSPPTATALVLLATALLRFDVRPTARVRLFEGLVLAASFVAVIALLGHALGADPLYRLARAPVIGVAVPTAIGLLLVSTGMLLERPRGRFMRVATSPGPGGVLLRRLSVPALIAAVGLGLAIKWSFSGLGLEDSALAVATLLAAMIAVGSILLTVTATHIDRTAEALEASRLRTQVLLEQASDGIFVADLDGRYTEVNRAACLMLGYAREELLGKTIMDLIPPEDIDRLWQSHNEMLVGGKHLAEWTLRRKDGTFIPVEVSAKILPDRRWQGFVRDISERKRAEAAVRLSEARFSGIVSISADAIVSVDENQRITLFNDGAEKIFGHTRAEVVGAPLDILLPERLRAPHREHVREFAVGDAVARRMAERGSVIFGLRKDGTEFPADASISKLEVGGKRILTVALRDITGQKRLEAELRRAVEARDDVLGIVAHDLRSPLSTIVMGTRLLQSSTAAERDPRARESVEAIGRAADRMNRLIEDLLDVHRLEAGRLAIGADRLSTRALVSDATRAHEAIASSAAVELRTDLAAELPEVWADRDRLLQVLENLLGNAFKFTGPGGRITVGAAPRGIEVLFWVRDTGPGISADELPRLFDRFWQERKLRRRGAGLGLRIVKGIVEAHGGRVWAESTPGSGATLFFTIPTASARERAA